MKSFLKISLSFALLVGGFKIARAEIGLSPAAENAISSSPLERALYTLMALPAGDVLARRVPSESRAELDSLVKHSPVIPELFAVRAQEDERQLDFKAAERDWRQAVELSKNQQEALLHLADFYERRLEPQLEVTVLLRLANLPPSAEERFKPDSQQAYWQAIQRALDVCSAGKLLPDIRINVYETWINRYPKRSEPLREYFQMWLAAKSLAEARTVASRIHAAFPKDLSLNLGTDAELARLESGDRAAMDLYSKQFSPLWPADLRASYYSLLSDTHQLRTFLADARNQAIANPTSLQAPLRAFFYYEQEHKNDLAAQQLLQLQSRRSVAKVSWTASELKTVAALFLRVSDNDEAAHANYLLYVLSGATAQDKALALSSLIDLLLDVPEQPLQFGSRDLSLYRNVATLDGHPGFLNGILSLVLNTTTPEDQYQTASQASVAYFHRAMASRLIERMKVEFPTSPLMAPLEAKLFSAYSVYGQQDAILRLTPPWLAAHKTSPDNTKVALLLAETYAAANKVTQELAIYDSLLQKLAAASAHRPLGEPAENLPAEGGDQPRQSVARSPEYSQVLDLYISRLTQLKRLRDAVALYRREIDRNPDDPGIYERLALFVEQNHFDSDLEFTYRAAMKRFNGTTWADKLARFYIRHRQSDAYVALAEDLTGKFEGSDLAKFISSAVPGAGFSLFVYRQVNLYAHQRFPHNLTFVRNLLVSYRAKGIEDMGAYENLLRANWFYDANLRNEFFAYLSLTGKLQAELAALPKPEQSDQENNTVALLQYAEGQTWLANFESAAPAFTSLAKLTPGDDAVSLRAITVERSLAPSNPDAFDQSVRLAEQRARALPGNEEAATLVGEIYADRELYSKAAPWWNKIVTMRPGVAESYLTSATVFWDYYQFPESLRIIQSARAATANPALFAYEAGAIHENQNDLPGAIDEYLKSLLAVQKPSTPRLVSRKKPEEEGGEESEVIEPTEPVDSNMAEQRLLVLAKRKQTSAEIDQRTAALAQVKPFNPVAFRLRLVLLENQERRSDIHAFLSDLLGNVAELEQLDLIQLTADRLGFEDLSVLGLQRAIALNSDPVKKLAGRLQLAKFYQGHGDVAKAEKEYSSLLSDNPNLLGIVRATTDFYWEEKQPKKAVAILEQAAARAQPPYPLDFRREAAQKAADSADYATARRLLDSLLQADPYNGDLLAAKAATYASEGDNNGLIGFYSAQLKQLQSATLSGDEKTQRTSALRRGYINALITAKQLIEALEQYQLLINSYPEDASLTREAARFAEANQLADRLNKYYEKATLDSPRNYRWPMVLARIYTSLRRYPEAVAAFNKAIYVRPDRTDLYLAKVDLETRLLRFEDALKTYQKLYDASYHDSQYLVSQASLQARLGRNSEAVRLLKEAYVSARPKELSGYVAVMGELSSWRMYTEVDQIYQEAKSFLQPDSENYQQLASMEGKALVALRRPVEALQAVANIRRATGDPKHPWTMRPQMSVIGATVDDLYTPEEKAAFAVKLRTPQAVPAEINLYDVACDSGFTELAAERLNRSAASKPLALWQNLNLLQSQRLLNADLARQLEAIAPGIPIREAASIDAAILAAYARAGDAANELRMSHALLRVASITPDMQRYADLLIQSHADLPGVIRELSVVNPTAANQLTQELLAVLPGDQATAVVQARGANLSNLWIHAYSAITDLFFLSPNAVSHFDLTLGPRTVSGQLAQKKGDALQGDGWYYYAARYGDYLTREKNPSAASDFLPATVEAAPIASDSYVALGSDELDLGQIDGSVELYQQALELSPNRADVQVRIAEAEHAHKHSEETVAHLKNAMEMLTKRASTDDYETAKTILTLMNQYNAVNELQAVANIMLAADIQKNGAYEFQTLAAGILLDAPDRRAAVNGLLRLAQVPEQLLNSPLLKDEEKRPFYLADLENKRRAVPSATGEAAAQASQNLRAALVAYAEYLNRLGDSKEAWKVLHQIEPKTERPPMQLLELAAKTGHLYETLAQFDAGTIAPPAGEQILAVAGAFEKQQPVWALQIRDWEYSRELRAEDTSASAYFGMAEVRIEQKRAEQALALIKDVTLSVDAPFQNLPSAVALLEKNGMTKDAAEYAREWRRAEPWNPEASWAVARTTQDKALIDSVRKSEQADYALRAEAARALRDLKAPVAGSIELDLLTHQSISVQEATQPFFVLARLRAKDYAAALALKPSLREARLALAEAAFTGKQDVSGMAAWNSYQLPGQAIPWLHSSALDRAMDPAPDRTLDVEELAAAAFTKEKRYAAAEALYDRIAHTTDDKTILARIENLRSSVSASARLDRLNRSRAPVISTDFAQARIVRPKLTGVRQ